jgi:hypothetical protein
MNKKARESLDTVDLIEAYVTSIGLTSVQSSNMKIPFADKVAVYYLKDGKYYATDIDKVSNLSKYKLTANYDRTITTGGRVRVIVAEDIN